MFRFLWLLFKFAVNNLLFSKNKLPSTPNSITTQWLTQALQQNKILDSNTIVEPANPTQLDGGVHSQVYRFSLRYKQTKQSENQIPSSNRNKIESSSSELNTTLSNEKYDTFTMNGWNVQQNNETQILPQTIVIKITAMKLSFWKRLIVLLKKEFGFLQDKMVINATSYEKETNFYKSLASSKFFPIHTPKCYCVMEDYYQLRFVLVLEDLSQLERGEPHGFRVPDSKVILRNLAKLHATFWNSPLLHKLNIWRHGGYWIGSKEGAREKKNIKFAWARTLQNLKDVLPLRDIDERLLNDLGAKLEYHLHFITSATTQHLRTLVHGDYKISNLFLDPQTHRVSTIDWQWIGRGCNATDVMYFLQTSIHIDDLRNDFARRELLEYYYQSLLEFGIGNENYSFDVFVKEYEHALLDFFVFVVTSKWCNMGPREVQKYAEKHKDGLHLRSFPHIEWLIRQALHLSNKYLNQDIDSN